MGTLNLGTRWVELAGVANGAAIVSVTGDTAYWCYSPLTPTFPIANEAVTPIVAPLNILGGSIWVRSASTSAIVYSPANIGVYLPPDAPPTIATTGDPRNLTTPDKTNIVAGVDSLQSEVTAEVATETADAAELRAAKAVDEGHIADLETAVGLLDSEVGTLNTEVGGLTSRTTTLEGDVGVIAGEINDINTHLMNNDTAITGLGNEIGVLAELPTANKTDLVSAIVELHSEIVTASSAQVSETITITQTMIDNNQVALAYVPVQSTLQVTFYNGILQRLNVDYIVNGNVISWSQLALEILLEVGDVLSINYTRG